MTRTEYWNLISRLCEQANDDAITSVRVPLLFESSMSETLASKHELRQFRQILGVFKSFLSRDTKSRLTAPEKKGLPLVLSSCSSASNLLNLEPVMREARERSLLGLVIAGDSVPDSSLEGYPNVVTQRALWQRGKKLGIAAILRTGTSKLRHLLKLLEPMDAHLTWRVRKNYGFFLRHFVNSQVIGAGFQKVLKEWRPSCVLSGSDYWPFEFQLFCQARKFGIPNAMIQHGDLSDVTAWPTYAETFLIWGKAFEQHLIKLGAPRDRLRICGMPASDRLFRGFQTSYACKDPDRERLVCLVLSHTHERQEAPEIYESFRQYLVEVVRLLPDVRWLIRLHPAEDDSFYREIGLINHPQLRIQEKRGTLEQSVAEADVVCTIRSTAGLQAMMMHKPVIVMDVVPGVECSTWWPLYGGGVAAKTATVFKSIFEQLINDHSHWENALNAQQRFLNGSFANQGRAASTIVDFLQETTYKLTFRTEKMRAV
jgi:hypothetical protein